MIQKIYPSRVRDLVLSSLDELKAVNPVTINVKKISNFTDYMMIASGTSSRHIQSIGEKVLEDLKSKKIKPLGVEGQGSEEWLLIDLGDVVLHLMSTNARTFYDLESLWDPDL
ncbi:MAG: ribosome silencing factor [SAR86 cluster bacterium]|jgi:ribosome-associated protein|nr:ribosome silencing factor [SAR86 cluster bacterium]